ncbi:MAG: UDP-N-acetylmuramoyl-L-alanine--D-glutamate ligase [Planctomycetota bacterium]|nr:MAG: UDP-N-acetylmuramoyl-L-alanine--D-glutamate ligase [Planctomycetota bacterium]
MNALAGLKGRRVLVLGLGAFGGGSGCARALARLGAEVTVTDLRPPEQLREALQELDGLPVRYALGGHSEELFAAAELVVVNPAVPNDSPWLAVARRCGCTLTTDLNLALAAARDVPAFAVTGTHGKSTCVALARHLLGGSGARVTLAGNLGGSILDSVAGLGRSGRLVLELSSFQTERLELPVPAASSTPAASGGWPAVAAVTSLSADHLDRHGSVEAYHAAKRRLLAFQGAEDLAVLPLDLPDRRSWAEAARGQVLWLSPGPLPSGQEGYCVASGQVVERLNGRERTLFALSAAPFQEPYRLPSLLAAVAGARGLGLPAEEVAARLRSFQGLPHRMEQLPAPRGLAYIDNGVATHPEPTVAALEHLGTSVVLVAGGKDKHLPLDELAAASRGCRRLHLFGSGGERLARLCRQQGLEPTLHAGCSAAVAAALADAQPGDAVLFSPSFSSYDEFRNFRDRALVFRESCRRMLADAQSSVGDTSTATY